MKYKVTISYDKVFMFDDIKEAMDFAVMAKRTVTPSKYDSSTKVTIELLTDEELREEEEE